MKNIRRLLKYICLPAALLPACANTPPDRDSTDEPIATFRYQAGNGALVTGQLYEPVVQPDLEDPALDEIVYQMVLDGRIYDVVGRIDRETGFGSVLATGDAETVRYTLDPMPVNEGGLRAVSTLYLPDIQREMGARVTMATMERSGRVEQLVDRPLEPFPRPFHEGATAPALEGMRLLVASDVVPQLQQMVINQRAAAKVIVEQAEPGENFDLLAPPTRVNGSAPFEFPTPMPTETATVEPSVEPTMEPTVEPTIEPTVEPTIEPTVEPTIEPTVEPTIEPTVEPTTEPTVEPTYEPTATAEPTDTPAPSPSPSPTPDPCAGQKSTKGPSKFQFAGINANLWGITIALETDHAEVKSACVGNAEPHANGGGTLKKTEHAALDKSCDKLKYAKSFEVGGSVMGIIENDAGCTNDGSEDHITFIHGHISGYGADIDVKFGDKRLDLGCGKVACLRGSKRKVFCVKEANLNANTPNPMGKLGAGDDAWSLTSSEDPTQCKAWKTEVDKATEAK
jgi:hypothetical protein